MFNLILQDRITIMIKYVDQTFLTFLEIIFSFMEPPHFLLSPLCKTQMLIMSNATVHTPHR